MSGSDTKGCLILIVGPSGAGKDSLLDAAKQYFAHDSRFVFPRRYISRPSDSGGEAHIEVSPSQFKQMVDQGQFILSWEAHDLRYGIHRASEKDLALGKVVVINASRSVIHEARKLYQTLVASVLVDLDILEDRLRKRERETEPEIQRRLTRAAAFKVNGPRTVTIDNSGDLNRAAQHLIKVLTSAATDLELV